MKIVSKGDGGRSIQRFIIPRKKSENNEESLAEALLKSPTGPDVKKMVNS